MIYHIHESTFASDTKIYWLPWLSSNLIESSLSRIMISLFQFPIMRWWQRPQHNPGWKCVFNVFSKSSTKNICKEHSFALQARLRWLSEVWRQKRRRGGKRRRGFVVNVNENTSLYFSLFSWRRFRWSWFMEQANKVCDIESYKRYSFHSVNDSNFLLFPDCKGLP